MFRHIREACVELAASTAYCFGIEADYFSVSYLRHAFKEAPVYFLCRSFRLVGVPNTMEVRPAARKLPDNCL